MTVYYFEDKNEDRFRVYDDVTYQYSWQDDEPKEGYEIFKGFTCSDDGLIKFSCHFKEWCENLKDNEIWKCDYIERFKTNYVGCEVIFNWLKGNNLDDFQESDTIEFSWIERCNNNSVVKLFCEPGSIIDSYTYDFKLTFPTILGSGKFRFEIPPKRGKEVFLKEIDFTKNLQKGMYHVLISSDDVNFNKIFNYSKDNVYCDIQLYQAYKCRKNGMKVNIELIQDKKPNAYLYDKVVSTYSIFGKWYKTLSKLREEFPDNKLIKHLMSSIWGRIAQFNKRYLTFDEMIEKGITATKDFTRKDCDYFMIDVKNEKCVLVNAKKPYKYGKLARIKCFLLAQARVCIANIALLDIDSVTRIHTDSVTFNKPHDDVCTKFKTYPELRLEKKSSGKLIWHNVNHCERV